MKRVMLCAVAMMLMASTLGPAAISSATGLAPPSAATKTTSSPPCPTGAYCATIPTTCVAKGKNACGAWAPCTSDCPSIIASPTTNLAPGQAVNFTMENFPFVRPATVSSTKAPLLQFEICPDLSTTTPADCIDVNFNPLANQLPIPDKIATDVDLQPNGIATAAMVVYPDPPGGGDTPYPNAAGTGFYCDDANNPCDISAQLTVPWLPATTDITSATIPLNFNLNANSDACSRLSTPPPAILSVSSFPAANLLGTSLAAVTCAGSHPVHVANTTADSTNVADSVGTGLGQDLLGFTDNPEDPPEQQAFKSSNDAIIPIALTATAVIAAGQYEAEFGGPSSVEFPVFSSFNLTPNEVAGIFNQAYDAAQTPSSPIDRVDYQTTPDCPQAYNSPALNGCSVLELINPIPGDTQNCSDGGWLMCSTWPNLIEGFDLTVPSGMTSELTGWFCTPGNNPPITPPPAPYPVGPTNSFVDPNTAQSTWTSVEKSCASQDTFKNPPPPATGPTLKGEIYESALPTATLVAGTGHIPGGTSHPQLAFGEADWADAVFSGASTASLQNAAGHFVAPSQASLDAAMNDATPNPDGSVSFNKLWGDTSNAAAYPLPTVLYAVVPKVGLTASEASVITTALKDILSLSKSDTSALPPGYVPLPTSLYDQAVKDVAADVHATPIPPTTTTTSLGASPTTMAATAPASVPTTTTTLGGTAAEAIPSGKASSPAPAAPGQTLPGSVPEPIRVESSAQNSPRGLQLGSGVFHWVLLIVFIAAGACALAGPPLLLSPEVRKRWLTRVKGVKVPGRG